VSLPFKHLLTSNYDPSLEQHHYPPNEPISISPHYPSAPQFIVEFADDNYTRRIVHVHGRYDEAQYLILTEEDYRTYIRSVVLDDFWRVVPATGRFVFFGFGFEDFDLLYAFRRRMALQGNNPGPRHFAIMPLDNPTRENTVTVSNQRRLCRLTFAPTDLLIRGGPFPACHRPYANCWASVDLIRSAWKRFVLIVQPLQFPYSVTGPRLLPPADFEDRMSQYTGLAVGSVASGSGTIPSRGSYCAPSNG
jgi:hypothetical protein